MLALDFIRKNKEEVQAMLDKRDNKFDLENFLKIDAGFRDNNSKLEELLARRNVLSKERTPEAIERVKKLKQDIADLSEITEHMRDERDALWSYIPNMLDARVPMGKSDKDNVSIKTVGKPTQFNFEPKWHDELAVNLGILDIKAGVKVSGSGFYYWKGLGAKLVSAVMEFTLDYLASRGYVQFITPILAKQNTFFGTGYLPFAQDQLYTTAENISLIGTSEQTLVAYHENETIKLDKPKKYTALTPCFRTEAGSYGKDTKGVFRVHQFYKVEQIIFCKPEESEEMHLLCNECEEYVLGKLGIPYRIVNVCTGDLGAPASIKYDIEGWFPGYNDYRELTSNSNLLDYQTRRLNIKCKDATGANVYPHTISATAITERAVLALIENHQNKDGEIVIPEVLVPYMKGITKITKQD